MAKASALLASIYVNALQITNRVIIKSVIKEDTILNKKCQYTNIMLIGK